MSPEETARAFMVTTYGPTWADHLLPMLLEAKQRALVGAYRPGPRDGEGLTTLYDEIYLAVTNVVPHKPPLVGAQGWRADDVVAG